MFAMNDNNCIVFNWNIRGLNGAVRRQVMHNFISNHRATIVCLQETKLQTVNDQIISKTLGQQFVGAYAVLPAIGVSVGVIIACSVDYYLIQDIQVGEFSVSATVKCRENGLRWTPTGVYGPQHDHDKECFILEIKNLQPALLPQWCILGDFNLIFRADHKSTCNINRRLMNCFKSALDYLELKEMKPQGHRFTWSTETDNPTFTRIDHIFVTREWELTWPNSYFQALSTLH